MGAFLTLRVRAAIVLEDRPEIGREGGPLERPVQREEVERRVGADHATGFVEGDEPFEAGGRSDDAEQLADSHIVVRGNRLGDIGALSDLTQARCGFRAQDLDSRSRQLRLTIKAMSELVFREFTQGGGLLSQLLLQA